MATEYRSAEFPLDSTFQPQDQGFVRDAMLNDPTVLNSFVTAKVNDNLLSKKIFNTTTVSGGVMVYTQILHPLHLEETSYKSAFVEPGGEFPEIDQALTSEEFTRVRTFGGRVAITDEAIKRNDTELLGKELVRLSNMMVRDMDQDAVAAFHRAIEKLDPEYKAATEVASVGWNTATKTKAADKIPATSIENDLEELLLRINEIDLGYNYSTLLVSPKREKDIRLAVGASNVQSFLGQYGFTIERSQFVSDTEAWLLAPQQLGTMGVETPITTTPWRDEAHRTNHTHTYATVGHAITDPLAMLHLTGIDK